MLMVFFLSIGLLLDLDFVWKNLGTVLLLFLVVTLFKSALNIVIFRSLHESWQRAFMSGVLISQLGEFSFLLAASAAAVAAISPEESKLIISVTVFSLALSPFWLSTARRLQRIAERRLTTLKLVFEATFVGERLLARRGTRWTRRVAESMRNKANTLKEKILTKRAITREKKNSLQLNSQVDLPNRSSKSDDA